MRIDTYLTNPAIRTDEFCPLPLYNKAMDITKTATNYGDLKIGNRCRVD